MKEVEELKKIKNNERKQKTNTEGDGEKQESGDKNREKTDNQFDYFWLLMRFSTHSWITSNGMNVLHPACIYLLILNKDR